ncbi:MAG: polyprenyl synthetase family protein, partial [Aquirufa sp.]
MSYSISSIQAPIDDSMKAFEGKFKTFMKTKVMLLDTIMNYIVQRKGKQMRPMFV